ncbi:BREX-3 system P-loop-containing protein BrxF [Clostridium neonatale]|uniref:BREX-3 system P-loop-containing protein BrxF n=1 Tax=Clostridium neonatale TaxID=137838 RepID=UPI00291B6BE0|nr:BREX-3 system P-loop-containing protein BrxF [Clostridium neonatale]CAI3202774.1 putative BREX-3 system P-loop-containing protein BrxF [Clostridium neonatale]CAI3214289.1 putative BREX-3 system P-loop-containing protein BrxF [Clostridium neonatale]CAI3563333.1 putative BREX-3 system P-loop-containing protein BrxF [Clostridium neonatale]
MGIEVSINELDEVLKIYNARPIIICNNYEFVIETYNTFKVISVGIELSNKLSKYEFNKRNPRILNELDELLINNSGKYLIIKDIDILFNPNYKFDVLKYFCNLARIKQVMVLWNGDVSNGILKYSESGYLDYKKYIIKNYDIICVK